MEADPDDGIRLPDAVMVPMSLGSLAGQTTGTHTTNNTQLLEIVRLPVAARKGLRTVY